MTILAWQRAEPAGAPTAPAAVLVHGWGGDGPGSWQAAAERLVGAGVAVLVCDLPGHGESADVVVPDHSEPAAWAAATLLADLDTLHVGDVTVVGHGLGGIVAGHLAVTAADRVRRLVLVSCDDRAWLPSAGEVAAALRDPGTTVWHADVTDALARAQADRRHHLLTLAQWAERAAWPAPARLGALRTPVLLAVGTQGQRRPHAPRLARLLHDARLVTVPGDDRTLLAAPELADAVAEFAS